MKGGPREGSGRKVGSPNKNTQEIRDIISSQVDFADVVGKLMELVNGVTVQDTTAGGDVIVYQKEPNTKAAEILLAYAFGKPKQQMDVKIEDSIKTLEIEWVGKDKK